MDDDRIIGCLPGETPAGMVLAYQAIERARVAAENRQLREEVATLTAELAEARAALASRTEDLVWAVEHCAYVRDDGVETFIDCDGTPASIAAAVEKARKGQ